MKQAVSTLLLCLLAMASLSAQADLELTATVSNNDPGIYKNVDYVLTLRNRGPQTATNVVVRSPREFLQASYGLVVTQITPATGTWDIFSQNWTVPTLAANATTTLTMRLFTMKVQLPTFFAEVFEADQNDPDSQPNNGNGSAANEDDEVALGGPAPATCQITLSYPDLACRNIPDFGDVIDFKIQADVSAPAGVDFVKIGFDPSFFNSVVIPVGVPSAPPLGTTFTLNAVPAPIYAQPLGITSCVIRDTLFPPPGCGTPPNPSDCLLPFFTFNSQVFCVNGGTFGLKLDFNFAISLGQVPANTAYEAFLDGQMLGTGNTSSQQFFGLDGSIPMPQGPALLEVKRASDGSCITQLPFDGTTFCIEPPNGFCFQQAVFPWHEWISRVTFDGIDNPSGKSQISDFTYGQFQPNNQFATVQAGESLPITLKAGFSFATYDEYFRVWLDADRSGFFDDNELIFEGILPAPAAGANVSGTLAGSLQIPSNVEDGIATMKIAMKRGSFPTLCGDLTFGEIELYSVSILGGQPNTNPCSAASVTVLGTDCDDNGTPESDSDDRWYIRYRYDLPGFEGTPFFTGAGRRDADGNFFFVPITPATEREGTIGQATRFGPIQIADFQEVQFNASMTEQPFCQLPFATATAPAPCSDGVIPPPAPNCAASSEFPWEDWIGKVKIGAFEKPSGKSQYSDFTTDVIPLTKGITPLVLTSNFSYFTYDENWRIWIDFNHDGQFSTPGEVAFEGILAKPINGTPAKTLNGNLNVPPSALTGMTHARVIMRRSGFGLPCGVQPFGEVEDYTVNIANAAPLAAGTRNAKVLDAELIEDFTLFPNPAGDRVSIDLGKLADGKLNLLILNQLGQTVFSSEIERAATPIVQIDLSRFQNGQYFVAIESPRTRRIVKKLAVARGY